MIYLILIVGIVLTLYAFVVLDRVQKESSLSVQLPHFRDAFPTKQNTADTGLLYELKEKVEDQLAELHKQKEIMTYLIMRLEKKLDTLNENESHITRTTSYDQNQNTLSAEDLERARLHNEIFIMHDQGMTVDEISKQVARGKGEVKLILKLRK